MNLETPKVNACHFALPIDRQQPKGITRSTERGGDYPLKQTSGGTQRKQQHHESPLARILQSAGNSEGRGRLSKASSLIQGG